MHQLLAASYAIIVRKAGMVAEHFDVLHRGSVFCVCDQRSKCLQDASASKLGYRDVSSHVHRASNVIPVYHRCIPSLHTILLRLVLQMLAHGNLLSHCSLRLPGRDLSTQFTGINQHKAEVNAMKLESRVRTYWRRCEFVWSILPR